MPGRRGPRRSGLLWRLYAVVYDPIWDGPLTSAIAGEVLAASPPRGLVVDLGCGTGLVARHFLAVGRHVVGVDSSSAMIRRAQQSRRLSSALTVPAERTGLEDASGAVVILSNVLHLVDDPAEILAEARRVAGPEGTVVLTWPTGGATHDRLLEIDLAMGRPVLASALSDLLRRTVSLVALVSRVTPRASALLEAQVAAVAADAGLRLRASTVAGCQRVVVLEPRTAVVPAES